MQTLWQDLRYGVRLLLKQPGFTLIAVITLALGIGANTAIFTIVNAVLLRPLPYPAAERLMQVGRIIGGRNLVDDISAEKFTFLRANLRSFETIAATQGMGASVQLADESQAEYIRGYLVSADFLRVLGVAPALGRSFTPEEDSPAGARVAMLSDGLWRGRFAADAGMLGRSVTLNGRAYTVVGILPPGFEYFGPQDVFLPSGIGQTNQNEGHNWSVIGRLQPGVTPGQAQAEAQLLFDKFRAIYPRQVQQNESFGVLNWRANLTSGVRELLWILLGAVSFVLLIACANVANLQLARAATRRKELAVRLALGAGGGRLVRQLLTEGVLLALVGGGAGLLLATWGLEAMLALLPGGLIPRAGEISLDGRVLIFALGMSVLTGVVAGLAPALQTLRVDVNRALKESGGKTSASVTRGRLRSALVVVEMALALALTVGAGLLLRTFANLRGVEPGFEARNVLTFELAPLGKNYDTVAKLNDLYRRALEKFRALPGVETAALTNKLPLDGRYNLPYKLVGQSQATAAEYRLVSLDYFRAMKMTLRQGRAFNASDAAGAEPVVIVNEAFARRNFANVEPLGQQMCIGCEYFGDLNLWRVVGVVNETKQRSLSEPAPPTVFIPLSQAAEPLREIVRQARIVLRTTGEPLLLSAAVRHELRQLDPTLPPRNLRPLEELVSRSIAPQRFNLSLLSLFAGLGLLLASIGIYGVMAYSVSQRTHEIGIRLALGAQTRDVLRLVVRQGMKLALLGVALGLIAALALTQLLKNLLFGVSATDPVTFALIALLLSAVAFVACFVPARRATRVDPLMALRYE
jgi:putative ABC transport system permease protein